MTKKYLDNNGFTHIWGKLKEYFQKKSDTSLTTTDKTVVGAINELKDAQTLIDLILQKAMEKRTIQTQKDIHGDTGIQLAALIGSKETVEKLLTYGFDKGIQNNVKFYNL